MFDKLKKELMKDIIHQNGEKNEEKIYDKLDYVLEMASKDIVYDHLIFQKDVTYEKFVDILKKLI